MWIQGDADQLEQVLINLIRNAVDASLETGGKVYVGWGPDRFDAECVRARRRARAREYVQFVCAILHDEARRIGNRTGAAAAR